MIIDIHTHCFPDKVAQRAIYVRSQKFGLTPATDGTVGGLKRSMLNSDVNISVLQNIASKPEKNMEINRWAASVQDDNIFSFGSIHPDFPNWKEEIIWLASHGFKGVKVHGDCQNYFVDDPHLFKIYEAIFDAGLIILFHSGVDTAFSEPFHTTPARLKKVLDTFSGSPIIAAHMGGYRYWDDAEKYLLGKDIYFDTAYSIHELGIERATDFIKTHGPEKILFGTDSPWRDQAMDISLIKLLKLNPDEINGILGNNAKKLLQLDK